MKSIAIIQHIANDGPGFFGTWLQQAHIPFEVFRMFEGCALPHSIADHSGLCMLGGTMSANDPLPYFSPLLNQVREAIALEIPVIGHCLGGQLLSRALGGTVQASENLEIGWSDVQVVHASGPEWFGANARLPLFQWHGESFSIPSGAQRVATGAHCANQAFLVGNMHLGMQFHCEVDEEKVRDWLETGAAEIRNAMSPGVQQPADILPTLNVDLARSQTIASHIYRRWAQGLRG